MATIYTVTGKVIKVSIGGKTGNRVAHILQRGDVVPEGVDAEQLKRLEERGFIKKAKSGDSGNPSGDVTIPEGDPTDTWTVPQLELFAKNKGIELTGGNKGEKLAAIQAALAAGSGS